MIAEFRELHQGLESATQELVKQSGIAIEEMTTRQISEALRQAIVAGDFIRHVRADGNGQCVVYIPYAREQELEFEIDRLKKLLTENGIEHRDLCQTPL